MRIISRDIIEKYIKKNAQAKTPLMDWYNKVLSADWKSHNDIKNTFNSADNVGNNRYVFNIGGNNYRLVAIVEYNPQYVRIRFIGTHAEYSKIKDIKNI